MSALIARGRSLMFQCWQRVYHCDIGYSVLLLTVMVDLTRWTGWMFALANCVERANGYPAFQHVLVVYRYSHTARAAANNTVHSTIKLSAGRLAPGGGMWQTFKLSFFPFVFVLFTSLASSTTSWPSTHGVLLQTRAKIFLRHNRAECLHVDHRQCSSSHTPRERQDKNRFSNPCCLHGRSKQAIETVIAELCKELELGDYWEVNICLRVRFTSDRGNNGNITVNEEGLRSFVLISALL